MRLADTDARGRLRLDGLARALQDVAIEDVQETGWGTPNHLWFVRSIRVDVVTPILRDRELELTTWCSGTAAIAAGRRWSVQGDAGGRAEVDSVWIHLGPDATPARIAGFDVYEQATAGRRVATTLALREPPPEAVRRPWPLRASDVDVHGHVNNAVHWEAVEEALELLAGDGAPPADGPLRAVLEYRASIDRTDDVALVTHVERASSLLDLWLAVDDGVRAAARLSRLG